MFIKLFCLVNYFTLIFQTHFILQIFRHPSVSLRFFPSETEPSFFFQLKFFSGEEKVDAFGTMTKTRETLGT